jgi:hypothetical protein
VTLLRMHRIPSGSVLGAAGFLIVGVFHAQLATGYRGVMDAMVTAQTILSILRGCAAVGVTVLETMLQRDASVTRSTVLWMVGNGGQMPSDDHHSPLLPVIGFSAWAVSEESGARIRVRRREEEEELLTLPLQESARSGLKGPGCDDSWRKIWTADVCRWMAGRVEHGEALRHLTEAVRPAASHTPHDRLWHLLNAAVHDRRSRLAAAAAGVPPPGDRYHV